MDKHQPQNIFAGIPESLLEEFFDIILQTRNFKVERIVSRGHITPAGKWYDQEQDEWVMLLQGSAELLFEHKDTPIRLEAGDHINIPSHTRHRVSWTDPAQDCIWLAIHYPSPGNNVD